MITRSRLTIDILLLFLLVLGIAPLVIFVSLVGAYREPTYYEALLAGFVFELLYGTGMWTWPFPFPVFLGCAVLYIIAANIRSRVR